MLSCFSSISNSAVHDACARASVAEKGLSVSFLSSGFFSGDRERERKEVKAAAEGGSNSSFESISLSSTAAATATAEEDRIVMGESAEKT